MDTGPCLLPPPTTTIAPGPTHDGAPAAATHFNATRRNIVRATAIDPQGHMYDHEGRQIVDIYGGLPWGWADAFDDWNPFAMDLRPRSMGDPEGTQAEDLAHQVRSVLRASEEALKTANAAAVETKPQRKEKKKVAKKKAKSRPKAPLSEEPQEEPRVVDATATVPQPTFTVEATAAAGHKLSAGKVSGGRVAPQGRLPPDALSRGPQAKASVPVAASTAAAAEIPTAPHEEVAAPTAKKKPSKKKK